MPQRRRLGLRRWPARVSSWALAALCGLALMLLAAGPAAAHATLQESTPSDGQILQVSPATVQLRFDEPVETSLAAIDVLAADGDNVAAGDVQYVAGSSARVAVGLRRDLPVGSYLVSWRVQSVDSHPLSGSFTFSVGTPGPVADAVASPRVAAEIGTWLGLLRPVGFVALMLTVGTFAFLVLCWPAGWGDRTTRRLLEWGLGVAGAVTGLGLLLQGVYATGRGYGDLLDPAVLTATASTRFGEAYGLRLLLLLTVALALRRAIVDGSRPPTPAAQVGIAAGLLGVVVTFPLVGHTGASPRPWLDVPLDAVHLAAVSVWMGGLLVLVIALVARRGNTDPGDGLSSAVARFSRVAAVSVAVLVATGAVVAWRQVGSTGGLLGTDYGRLLLAKVAGLVLILGFAAVSRATVARWLANARDRRPAPVSQLTVLRRSAGAELALGVIVVALASSLVATPPARTQLRPVTRDVVQAGPVSLDLTVRSTGTRQVALLLTTRDRAGRLADFPELRTTASLPGRDVGPIALDLRWQRSGRHSADRVALPVVGTWRLRVYVRTTDIDSYTADTSFVVR